MAAVAAGILVICLFDKLVANKMLSSGKELTPEQILALGANILFTLLFIIIIIKPRLFPVTAVISFFYSVSCAFDSPEYMMSLFMFFLTVSILLAFGFFERHRDVKAGLVLFVFLIERLIPLRLGYEAFVDSLLQTAGFSLVYVLSLYFIVLYLGLASPITPQADYEDDPETHETPVSVLNLALYDGIERSDMALLILVQQGKSYAEIAAEIKSTEGSMKNTFSDLYKKLGVKNKKEFLIKYGQAEITYIIPPPVFHYE